ncbi:uncharacterized protein LOC144146575 [Haemaphysalis longicornis]
MSFNITLIFVATLWTSLQPACCNDQAMLWCGGRLNPWEDAKAMTAATNFFLACKKDILALRLRGSLRSHANRLCTGLRLCYAFLEVQDNATTRVNKQVMACLKNFGAAVVTLHPRKYDVRSIQ